MDTNLNDFSDYAASLGDQYLEITDMALKGNGYEKVIVPTDYNGEVVDVIKNKQPLSLGFRSCYYPPLEPGTSIVEGMIYERDIAVPMRDGRKVYADIYRPVGATNIPLIIAWTPYGKRHWYGVDEAPVLHNPVGVPPRAISKQQVFEGPEPSYWCSKGYAVAHVDTPGIGYSEGDNTFFTNQSGKDGYDFIEWIAQQKWCNGKVGMCGNSALAMAQWFIASENPPHLAAIAPWEGTGDLYREWMAQGGIPQLSFGSVIYWDWRGPGLFNDPVDMILKYPMMNGYWEDMIPKAEKIKVPAYVTAGYGHPYHLRSAIGNFTKMKSKDKWLRMHREFEWSDLYENVEELCRFFDRYLKDIHNGWELTPKVRVEVTDAYDFDYVTNRPEEKWPIPRTQYTKFYLNALDGSLSKNPLKSEAKVKYDANSNEAVFNYTFTEDTELTGHSVLRVWVETDKGNEADVFVQVRKLGLDGEILPTYVVDEPDPGFVGKLRASHRELDTKESKPYKPVHTHKNKQPLSPGEIVPLDIEIWPNSRIWHKGETLQISVAGRHIRDKSWFLPVDYVTQNEGNHIIHTGGKYDSYFLAPVVPPKHKCGDYVYKG